MTRVVTLLAVLAISVAGAVVAWMAFPRWLAAFVLIVFVIGALSSAADSVLRATTTRIRLRLLRGRL